MYFLLLLPIVYACILPTNNTFQSEFNYMKMINFQFNNRTMREVFPSEKTCEITQINFPGLYPFQKIENFTCGLESCISWCQYNPNCKASLYSEKTKLCMRFSYLELTDTNRAEYNRYISYEPRVFYKGIIPYRASQLCVDYAPKANCEMFKRCGWNKGKRGYNDQIQGLSASGFCGRISCNKKAIETGT